jgi:putative transcriptional regulator
MFDKLVLSIKQAGAVLRGETEPSRVFDLGTPDVKQLRSSYQLSQIEFAALLGISVKTLRNWEQGRRTPKRQNTAA